MHHPLDFAMLAVQWLVLIGGVIAWAGIVERLAARRPLVEYEPRMQVPWSGFDLAMLAIAWFAFEIAAQWVVAPADGARPKVVPPSFLAAAAAARLAWLVFAIVYLSRAAGAYFDDMGLDLRKLKRDVWLGLATFAAAALPVYAIQILLTKVFGFESRHPLVELAETRRSTDVLLLATVVAVGVAPLIEEFLLRVLLQGWLEKKQIEARQRRGESGHEPAGFGPIAVSAAIFAILHVSNGPDWVALFVLALFLGYVYQRTHRIVPALTVHACVNALAMLELWRAFLAAGSKGAAQ
jgi:membrane protease YdiL (CAAX protease family)